MSRAWPFPLLVAGFAAIPVIAMGATIVDPDPWYASLVQPRWAPPAAAHAAGWTVIYALTALAGITAWFAARDWREGEWLVGLLALSGFLNIAWSLLFFRLHRPDWALTGSIALWLSVAGLIVFVWRRSMVAAALLVPYLLGATFAGYFTMTIVRLNGPIG